MATPTTSEQLRQLRQGIRELRQQCEEQQQQIDALHELVHGLAVPLGQTVQLGDPDGIRWCIDWNKHGALAWKTKSMEVGHWLDRFVVSAVTAYSPQDSGKWP